MSTRNFDPAVADRVVSQGLATAKRLCDGRVRMTGNASLRFDALPLDQQTAMVNVGILLSDYGIQANFRGKGAEVAGDYRSAAFRGDAWGLSDYAARAVRADAAGVNGGGISDVDGVFTVAEIYKDLTQPNTGLDFIPIYPGVPLGAQSVRLRRGSVTGRHGPIGDTPDMTPVGYSLQSDTRNLTWEGSLAATFMPGQVDAQHAGVDIMGEKRDGLLEVLRQRQHDLCWTGDVDTGALGIADPGNGTEIRVAPTTISTAAAMAELIMEHFASIKRASGGRFVPDTLLLSHNTEFFLAKQYGSNGDKTALAALKEALDIMAGKPVKIATWRKLDPITGNRDGVLSDYSSNEMFLLADMSKGRRGPSRLSLGPILIPEQVSQLQTRLYQLSKEGGVHVPEPTALRLVAFTLSGGAGE